jgi:hypothetical protein
MVYGCSFLEVKSNEFNARKERISKLARTSYTADKKTGIFFIIVLKTYNHQTTLVNWNHFIIVLKPSPARRVDPGPDQPGTGTGPGWWKNRKNHDPVWPGRPGGLTQQNPVATRWLLFFFLLKQHRFEFFFK